jgi:hypothetical protein
MKRTWIGGLMATALLLAACPMETEAPPELPGPPEEEAVCLEGEPFIEDGTYPLEVPDRGDAHQVNNLRWAAHEGCERFVIDFADDNGEPAASVGTVQAEVLRDLGVVRINLPEIDRVDPEATDRSFDGPLTRAAFSVAAPDGGTFVDVHLATEAEAYVAVLEDPARVVVDLRPGGEPIPAPAAIEDGLVLVLEPREGAEEGYPLTVTGYARTFEANVVVRLEQEGEDVYEDFTTATSWIDAWGYYELSIEDAPTGEIVLHVGDYSAEDGTWEGAELRLTLR